MRQKRQPDLYSLMHRYSDEAQYIIDRDTNRYVLVNRGFARLVGYSEEELLSGKIEPIVDIVDENYREGVKLLAHPRRGAGHNRLEIKIIQKSNRRRDVELTVHNILVEKRRLQIGSIRDISKRKRLQKQLEHQIQLQREKAIEVAKASLRIYQLTEKIKSAPKLSSLLLEADSEETLLERATRLLTDPDGLNYRDVVFYIKEGESLIPKSFSSRGTAPRKLSIYETSKITSVLRGEKEEISSLGEELLPLRGRGQTIGVAQIKFAKNERAFFAKSKTVKSEQRNLLKTIVDIIALAIVNLRLFQTVEQQSIVDELTGAYNRRFFENKLQEEMDRAGRYNRHLSLIYADLDSLKAINDSFGHEQGDLILKEIARLMKKSSRKTDFICRWGGDEFAIILPETRLIEAGTKAQKLRFLMLHHPFERVDGKSDPLSVTVSMSVTHFAKTDTTVSDLFKRADSALYRAKQKGGNRVEISKPDDTGGKNGTLGSDLRKKKR